MVTDPLANLLKNIAACRECAGKLPHEPRPVVQAGVQARILIIGQAPGSKVHASGVPWDDASGDRLREWCGIPSQQFYDPQQIAMMPMGFCYPGAGESADLPPRPECAPLWHERLLAALPAIKLILLVGQFAQLRYLPEFRKMAMTETVRRHAETGPKFFPLPHPSWRSTHWMRKNPWFEAKVLPMLRQRVQAALMPER